MSDPAYEIPNTIRLQGRYTEDLFLTSDNNYALISNDEINVTFGDDTLIGGDDKDIISAGEGNDTSITDQPDFNFDGTVDESELSILGEVLEDDEWL